MLSDSERQICRAEAEVKTKNSIEPIMKHRNTDLLDCRTIKRDTRILWKSQPFLEQYREVESTKTSNWIPSNGCVVTFSTTARV